METKMAYLDVGPMVTALRSAPDEFEVKGPWLHHIPSQHNFMFGPDDYVLISAACDCSRLAIAAAQRKELCAAFREWHANYWRPLVINREFAAHFKPRSRWRQWLIDMAARLHHYLLQGRKAYGHARSSAEVAVPAE